MPTKKKVNKSTRRVIHRIAKEGTAMVQGPIGSERESKPEGGLYATGELLQGKYCNVGAIRHTPREFIFDFIWTLNNQSVLASRVITSPSHAKDLYKALGENIEKYEKKFGEIPTIKPGEEKK